MDRLAIRHTAEVWFRFAHSFPIGRLGSVAFSATVIWTHRDSALPRQGLLELVGPAIEGVERAASQLLQLRRRGSRFDLGP